MSFDSSTFGIVFEGSALVVVFGSVVIKGRLFGFFNESSRNLR